MNKVLVFDNVVKNYTNDSLALKGVTFTIESGEFTALQGPSGSGKTTILNLATGLDKPSEGKVLLLEQELAKLSPDQSAALRRQHIGFVFQAYNLFPVLTALENVEYTLALNHIHPHERKTKAMEALAEVGLAGYEKRVPKELSGGQQQRVAVARAIVLQPKLVFADEPTANLDAESATRLISLFRHLNETKGITFLFSSHDTKILKAARRVIEVADGLVKSDTLKRPYVLSIPTNVQKLETTPQVLLSTGRRAA